VIFSLSGRRLNHVVEVLTGADTEKIRKWDHAQLSTYGIGKEHSRPEWAAIGRELVRLGFLRQTTEKFSVLELTDAGGAALKERRKITLTKPAVVRKRKFTTSAKFPATKFVRPLAPAPQTAR